MTDVDFLVEIRTDEPNAVLEHNEPGATVLEIGAGAGWQAKKLAERGMEVIAIDVADSNYNTVRVWPVVIYDGYSIPLPSHSIDILFSSSVLEHIPHVQEFQSELQRVLKPNGRAIHIMPNSNWRFWSTIAWLPFVVQRATARLTQRSGKASKAADGPYTLPDHATKSSMRQLVMQLLWPRRHGVVGNAITELYFFNFRRWRRLFQETGWQIDQIIPNGLFYTGQSVLGSRLSISTRRRLSRILGSTCTMFILRPPR